MGLIEDHGEARTNMTAAKSVCRPYGYSSPMSSPSAVQAKTTDVRLATATAPQSLESPPVACLGSQRANTTVEG